MALKTVGTSAFNVSGVVAVGKLVVVGAAILIGLSYVPPVAIHLPIKATALETFFGQATHTDVWDCEATFEEII